MIAAPPSSTSINVEHYLLSFRVTEMHYKWSYLELCITFFIPSLSLTVLEFTSNTGRIKAEQLNLPTFLALCMAHSEEIFLWFICAITLAPHLFYTLVMNSITVLCILLSCFLICTGANFKVDIDNIMIEKIL